MAFRDAQGHFISWEEAIELARDPEIQELAEAGRASLAWVLDLNQWEEDSGVDYTEYDSFRDFIDEAEAELAVLLDGDSWLEEGIDLELSVDTEGDVYNEAKS